MTPPYELALADLLRRLCAVRESVATSSTEEHRALLKRRWRELSNAACAAYAAELELGGPRARAAMVLVDAILSERARHAEGPDDVRRS